MNNMGAVRKLEVSEEYEPRLSRTERTILTKYQAIELRLKLSKELLLDDHLTMSYTEIQQRKAHIDGLEKEKKRIARAFHCIRQLDIENWIQKEAEHV